MPNTLVAAIILLAAACGGASSRPEPPAPSTAHAVSLHMPPATAAKRVAALFARNGIPLVSNDGTVITTGPVDVLELSGGTGAGRVTGRVEYFVRVTVTGDSVATVTLTPWSRAVTPGKSTEQVVPPTCSGTTKCRRLHSRLAALTDSLRS